MRISANNLGLRNVATTVEPERYLLRLPETRVADVRLHPLQVDEQGAMRSTTDHLLQCPA